ncbi:hypothetical protein BY458DRAFT_497910 [Sporodiniella umbellata]|nr:hypothetical protein BY458DRAFT_497910 [Sporodiniella umbellata]
MTAPLRSLDEAQPLLGTYLLQGWVMTDVICPVNNCSFPLMRSKDGSISFCVHHDPLPSGVVRKAAPVPVKKPETETADLGMVDELAIRRQRREQSSKASQIIGQKLLQKWALLNEHCPSETCFGIPLLRHPTTKKMYCVICEKYIGVEEQETEQQPPISVPVKTVPETLPIIDSKRNMENKERYIEPTIERKEVIKRQKTKMLNTQPVLSTLSEKMDYLSKQLESTFNPVEVTQILKSIKACANAAKALVEAENVFNKNI